jgi:hypothetical protein
MIFSRTVCRVVFDCFQPITSRPREKQPSTPTACGMIQNMSRTTLERYKYFRCVSACWCHQLVMTGIQNVLLNSIGLLWLSLSFGLICPQLFGAPGGGLKFSVVVVNTHVAQSVRPGVVSATLLAVH